MGFLSTFWSFGYTRLSLKLNTFLESTNLATAPKIRRSDVINMLEKVSEGWLAGAWNSFLRAPGGLGTG